VAVAIDQLLEEGEYQPAAVAEFVAVVVDATATAFGAVAVAVDVAVALYIVAEPTVAASAVSIFAADCFASSSLMFVVVNDVFFGPSLKPPTTMVHLQLLPHLGSGRYYCCLRY